MATRDSESIETMAKPVFDRLHSLLKDATNWHAITVARTTYYAMNILKAGYVCQPNPVLHNTLLTRSQDHDVVDEVYLLHTISSLPQDILAKTSSTVLAGLAACTDTPGPLRSKLMMSPDFWATLRVLATNPDSAASVFEILEKGAAGAPSAITADNFVSTVGLLDQFATAANPKPAAPISDEERRRSDQPRKDVKADRATIDRACKAINALHKLTDLVPQLMQQTRLETNEAWAAYWLPIFQSLTAQCTNKCREVRQLAFSALQRSLLSSDLVSNDPQEWIAIFSKVLFPLILRLLKPEVYSSDREGMSEMRIQSASLLCKVYLQYLVLLSEWEGMLDLWVKIIEIMDRLMNSGQGDSLEEAVRENLKNVILFMSSSNILVPPSEDASKEKFWDETWSRVDRFLPDLRSDIMPPTEESPVEEETTPAEQAKEGEPKKNENEETEESSQVKETVDETAKE